MSRFRIQVWPERQVPTPELVTDGPWNVSATGVIARTPAADHAVGAASRDPVELFVEGRSREPVAFGEVYLTLLQLELNEVRAIEAWINRYGPMGFWWHRHAVGGRVTVRDPTADFVVGDGDTYDPLRARFEALRVKRARLEAERRGAPGNEMVETVEEFRLCASLLRDLARSWHALQQDPLDSDDEEETTKASLSEEEWEAYVEETPPLELDLEYPVADIEASDSLAVASVLLERYLTPFLQPFHPRLKAVGFRARPPSLAALQGVSLCNALGLELYNHVVEQLPYKTCENETCQRLFVRQAGRARFGQHRLKGVAYCSKRCAQDKARRKHRQRARAAGLLSDERFDHSGRGAPTPGVTRGGRGRTP